MPCVYLVCVTNIHTPNPLCVDRAASFCVMPSMRQHRAAARPLMSSSMQQHSQVGGSSLG